jgi:archaellum component FlaD/FlaE
MEYSMTGEEHFLTAIIEQAIEDCAYTGTSVKMLKFKRDAIEWIVGKDPEFLNYYKMLGMDSNTIRNKIIRHVDMSYTQKQKLKIKSEEKFFA